MPETMSSDPKLDTRLLAVLDKHHARSDALEADLHAALVTIEMEHYFAESCAGEQFLRDQGRDALKRGETASTRFYGVLAETWKQVREKRFPDLIKQLNKKLS